MGDRYGPYCVADETFYDDPGRAELSSADYPAARMPLPRGWHRAQVGPWVNLIPEDAPIVEQGWKVHVSATLEDAGRVVDLVVAYCLAHSLPMKFLSGPDNVALANSKYADRRSSGKLVTLYPDGEERLRSVLEELSLILKGTEGPYILSDVRWENGPLFLRYGGFIHQDCRDAEGRRVPALRRPDGVLVPDVRGTVFELPEWAQVPDFLADTIKARQEVDDEDDFPFDISGALHISNGGGVYLATDQQGRKVVLREARPHAGLDMAGRDAVERLLRERDILLALRGLDFAPELYEYRQAWEHHYLVEEYIEGERLEDAFTRRCPLACPDPGADMLREYTDWALDVLAQVEVALAQLHSRGIAFGDLTPYNILIRPDGRCALVDFEVSFRLEDDTPVPLGTAGFVSPAARTGTAVDQYALAALRLYLFLPLNMLLDRDASKAELAARAIPSLYPVPDGFGDLVAGALHKAAGGRLSSRLLASSGTATPVWPETPATDTVAWTAVMDSLAAGILASATPERKDRLFPGDIEQFGPGGQGLGLSYGAAGVLYALDACGYQPPEELVQWLVDAVNETRDINPGLYDGLAGIAWALDGIGMPAQAARALDRLLAGGPVETPGLHSGQAGIALTLLHFARATGDTTLADRALEIGGDLAALTHGRPSSYRAPALNGLMDGWTGLAALFLHLYAYTGAPEWLHTAHTALVAETNQAEVRDGMLYLREDTNRRLLPYLAAGGIGTGMVAAAYLRHDPSAPLAQALQAADNACRPRLTAASGLYEGRASMLLHLAARAGDEPALRSLLDRHLKDLSWQALCYKGYHAFPGRLLRRLSTDVATGSAGILLAIHCAVRAPILLPGITDFPRESAGGDRK